MNRKCTSTKIIKKRQQVVDEQHTILIRARIKLVLQGQEPKADKNRREKADVRILELDEGRDEHRHITRMNRFVDNYISTVLLAT